MTSELPDPKMQPINSQTGTWNGEFTMLEGQVLYTQMVFDERRRQQRELTALDRSGRRFFRIPPRRPARVFGTR